jgi:hypothetical protein
MGWLFCASSKDELVAHIERDLSSVPGLTILGKAVRGSRLWYAVERGEQRFIVLYLTECDRRDHPAYRWGYKDMDESVHPYYYDCPIRLLDLTPQAIESGWRKAVRDAARRKSQPKVKPESGQVVTYAGVQYRLDAPCGARRGWHVARVSDNMPFRMKAKQLSAALRQD